MPLLDGVNVEADQIDPAKHRFFAMWRPPAVPKDFMAEGTICPCGVRMNTVTSGGFAWNRAFKHWQDGCFDEPQYVTVEEPIPIPEPDTPFVKESRKAANEFGCEGYRDEPATPAERDRAYGFFNGADWAWHFLGKTAPQQREAAESTPDPVAEEMERSRLAWGRARAKDLGVAPDDRQIRTLGIVPWEAAFRAGMEYAKTLPDKRPWDYWWWKCATCGRTALQSPEAGKKPSRCYGCRKPDWKLMKHQESFLAGAADWTHPAGEI